MHRNHRIKIEFLPALMNLPFAAIFIYILFSEQIYWNMFNSLLAGYLGNLQWNWIYILMGLIFGIIAYSVIIILLGMIRIGFLHNRVLNIIPTIFLAIMVVVLIALVNIDTRINLGYLFFLLGPQPGIEAYIGATLGVLGLIGLEILGIKQLMQEDPLPNDQSEEKPKAMRFRQIYPRFAATTTVISSLLGYSVLLSIGFYYPQTQIYWENIFAIFNRYFNMLNVSFWSWIGANIFLIGWEIYWLGIRHVNHEPMLQRPFIIGTFVLVVIGLIGLIFSGLSVDAQVAPLLTGLSMYVIIFLGIFMIIGLLPLIFSLYRYGITFKWSTNRKMRIILNVFMLALLLGPFWFVFYQPITGGPPNVDVPFQASIQNINGVSVPFEGNTIYPSFELQSNTTRQYLDLAGIWKYENGNGSCILSLEPRTTGVIQQLATGQQSPSYNDSNWSTMAIPGSVVQYEDGVQYFGVSWFRDLVNVPQSFANQFILFKLLGVNYFCDIWIDGQYVGYHEGGFTCFAFDVSQLLTPGNHLIAIRVDNPSWDSSDFQYQIIPDGCDFFNYGGIVRDLYIEASPQTSIMRADMQEINFTTTSHLNGSAEVSVAVTLKTAFTARDPITDGNLSIGFYPLNFSTSDDLMSPNTWLFANYSSPVQPPIIRSVALNAAGNTNFTAFSYAFNLTAVNYWSTKSPNLYALIVNITGPSVIDQFCSQVGFRNFSNTATQLQLNGADLKLAGVSQHEQYPAPIGRSLNNSLEYQDLILINSTGSNWWRGSYPFDPIAYIYSDRLGLACWEEAPVFWFNEPNMVEGFAREAFASIWIEILYRDINRPSILFWSAGNEPWCQQTWFDYLAQTQTFLSIHDPTRILSFACVSSQTWNPAFHNLRVLTVNTYGGTFDGIIGDFYPELYSEVDQWIAANPGKPVMSMEWGYWRTSGVDMQLECFEGGFEAFTQHPTMRGFTWWIAFDYYGTNYYNSMGIWNIQRTWYSPGIFNAMVANYTAFLASNM